MDLAVQSIREELDQIPDFAFPDGAEKPLIARFDPTDIPLMGLNVSGKGNTRAQLEKITEDYLEDPLAGVEGVAEVMVFGGPPREILVAVDQDKLTAAGMSLDAIVYRLRGENFNLSVGNLKEGYKDYLVRALGEFNNISEIENIVLGARSGNTIRLKDIARVYDTYGEDPIYARANLKPAAQLFIIKQSGGNTVQISRRVWEKLGELKPHLPPGLEISKSFDTADYINRAIGDVWSSLAWGGVLTIIVLYMFLHHTMPVLIISLAIPISLLASFLPMFITGMTINMISLGGLTLAVGMVVDNAIVVLENTFRHMQEKGEDRITAASRGASEVGMAIAASTMTTVGVFVPIVFTQGLAARIFQDLALTVTFSLMASLFVAVTLVPMMASKLLSVQHSGEAETGLFSRTKRGYRSVIRWVLEHKLITLGAANAMWLSSIAILIIMGKEFMPTANDETFMVELELPRGTRLEETDKITARVEELILKTPEVKDENAIIGLSQESGGQETIDSKRAMIIINLHDLSKRTRTVEQVNDDIRKRVLQIPGITKYNFVNLQSHSLGSSGGKPIEIKIFGKDLDVLSKLSHEAARRMSGIKGLVDVEETFTFGNPEIQVHFDRERMAQLGLDVARVARLMETAVKGTVASQYREMGEEIDIRVRLSETDRDSVPDLNAVMLTTPAGNQIRLSDVARVEIGSGPVRIFRDDQKRSVSLLGNTLDRDLNSVVTDIKKSLATLDLPMGYYLTYGGSYEDMRDSQGQLALAFLLAIVLVYMIMAAGFESLIHPFTIMFTVPFAFTGAVWAIFLCGMTLSVNSAIGIIMLAGIIVNNGIVLIDYVNQLRAEGMEIKEALVEAGATRLRPILMTTLTTILGLVPMAVMGGSGSEMRRPLAVSLIGGLTFGTVLTLLVVPTAYYINDAVAHRIYLLFMRILHPEELAAGGAAANSDLTKK
jgi:HAE1 family hydrophobic/amphiphilic exporter-1